MIDTKELRLGNWVEYKRQQGYYPKGYHQVTCIMRNTINPDSGMGAERDIEMSDIDPIPITPEILEKCGFEYTGFMSYDLKIPKTISCAQKILSFSGDYLYLWEWKNEKRSREDDVVAIWNKDIMKKFYLHQLQNLYFALTNHELTLSL